MPFTDPSSHSGTALFTRMVDATKAVHPMQSLMEIVCNVAHQEARAGVGGGGWERVCARKANQDERWPHEKGSVPQVRQCWPDHENGDRKENADPDVRTGRDTGVSGKGREW